MVWWVYVVTDISRRNNYQNVYDIVQYATENNILKFDVSYFKDMGGCSVTIDKKLNGNLTYDLLESCIN